VKGDHQQVNLKTKRNAAMALLIRLGKKRREKLGFFNANDDIIYWFAIKTR